MKAIQKIYIREAFKRTLKFMSKSKQAERMIIFNKTYMNY